MPFKEENKQQKKTPQKQFLSSCYGLNCVFIFMMQGLAVAGGSISQKMVPIQDVIWRWISGYKEFRSRMKGKKAGLIIGIPLGIY